MFISFTIWSIICFITPLAFDNFFLISKEVQDDMCHFLIRNGSLLSLLRPTLDGQRLLQVCEDSNFQKLDPIGKRLFGTKNMFETDLWDHWQDHQRLIE